MDPIRTYLGRLLLEEITPVVMVITTPLVEVACQKNGFSFVDVLLPFSLFPRIDVPVRTASDQPYRLQMFKLRLFYASNIRKQNYEAAEEHLKRVIYDLNEKNPPDLLSEPPQLETALTKSESDLCPAWIKTFNKELIRTISFSEHETFDHPVACILVASSKDEEPISKFMDLFNMDQTPPLLNEGAMDPKMLKHYVLLHDNQDSSTENAASIFAEMKGTFGQYDCKVLSINSLREGDENNNDALWLPYRNYGILDHNKKCCLNTDDLNQIREFMQDLATNHIIPYMEQKIRVLNQQVSATRKGFRNQIKNLWWRKGKDDVPEASDGPTYTFSSIESQIRILGDYAFMLRDYELALSNYRLLSTDYKLDKAWKRYAGVQEMSGLSYFMLDQSRKEAESCMENAFTTYLKVGSSAQRNATRCGLWWAEMLKARGQYRDASSVYTRISNEEPTLHAAMMLEQASCCYLLSRPPMLRKYGFHLILAGNRYYMSDQKQHAIRAYRNALFVYRDNSWSYINDHVHFNIGRWYGSLGALDVAIKHVLEILACSHQSQPTQNLFLNEFFHFVQSAGKRFDVHKLTLPAINMSSFKVIHEDHRTYASAAEFDVRESVWRDLEEEMIPTAAAIRTNWLDSQPKSSLKKYDYCICVAGEAVKVEVELKNPLQIPIPISEISLMCDLSDNDASTLDNGAPSLSADQNIGHMESSVYRLMDGDDSLFNLSKHDLVLGGGETKRVKLKVTPKVEGILKIVGVRWTLSDSVVGYRYFEINTTKKKKANKGARNSPGKYLILRVMKGIPKLEGCIDGLPAKAFMGDLRLLSLKLKNTSESAVKNIKMKINNPRCLIPGNLGDDLRFPQCLAKNNVHEEERYTDNKDTFKSCLFSFAEGNAVQGEESFSWPIWFHCGTPGKVSLLISIYYEMENSYGGMTYRTLRMHHILEVLPSLDVSFVISPCPLKLKEYLVRMDIVNHALSECFLLHQLSCVGDKWAISTLPSCTNISSVQTVLAGQALSCFFKIQDLNGMTNEGGSTTHGSDMLIATDGSRNLLYDISKSPLIDFHHQERHHQCKLSEGSQSLLDFVLISNAVGSNFESEAGYDHQFLSHHACHCSVVGNSSISWLMGGPHTVHHNFSNSICEVDLHIDLRNCSSNQVNVQVSTFDYTPDTSQNPSSDSNSVSDLSTKQSGWSDISLENDIKVMSTPRNIQRYHKPTSESAPPFVWSGSSAMQLSLEPACTARVPLKVCVFAPGTYNLSNYELLWKEEAAGLSVPGTGRGHPFYLTVLERPHLEVTPV
ncbi:Trafficking protein particle complex subunit 8 [Rhynchospora pubera]|uniref:Trafficking protein particle complex subunit 8 n=1 Tax=Rhynchospora pubera TaxID=906938 RepID=A0AAV8CTD3_9POAL|nr:Trafficking protein particle complex subunit 8 [Rhynchospora pubera]